MQATINILCMLIHVNDITYVELHFDHSKLCNYSKFSRNSQEYHKTLLKGFFFIKFTKIRIANRLKQTGITVGTAQVQKTVLLGTTRILRKVLEI